MAGCGAGADLGAGIVNPIYYRFFDFGPGLPGLLRGSQANPDGSFTIGAGRRSPQINALHARVCETMGAQDVTDRADMIVWPGVRDAGVCRAPLAAPFPSPLARPVPGAGGETVYYPGEVTMFVRPLPSRKMNTPSVALRAPTGGTPLGGDYFAAGTVDFISPLLGEAHAVTFSIDEDPPCRWQRAEVAEGDSYAMFGYAICHAGATVVGSEIVVSSPLSDTVDVGTIQHYP